MKPVALALVLTLAGGASASAQVITPDIDRTLWCASAFYWLAASAEDSGSTEEAETYDGWSRRLLDLAGPGLIAAGFTSEKIEDIVVQYDDKVLTQLSTDETPSYDVVTCPELVAGLAEPG